MDHLIIINTFLVAKKKHLFFFSQCLIINTVATSWFSYPYRKKSNFVVSEKKIFEISEHIIGHGSELKFQISHSEGWFLACELIYISTNKLSQNFKQKLK